MLARRQKRGLILDPVGKAKSMVLTDDGLRRRRTVRNSVC
ncbi:MAG: DUF6429 family protein [Pseudomonadota bacterium]